MTQRDDELLARYIRKFFGYGHFGAPIWFIGAEEGGGKTADEITRRLQAWQDGGAHALDDLRLFHQRARIPFETELQPTWKPLMITVLVARGEKVTDSALHRYQSEQLGRFNGETCLMERLPLPKRRVKEWPYSEWSAMPELRTRAIYQRTFEPSRVAQILEFIHDHRPPFVVFYGNRRVWRRHLPEPLARAEAFEVGALGSTRWYTTAHAKAWSNDAPSRFASIGADIASRWQR